MIRMAGQDGEGPIHLLEDEHTHQTMRQCRCSEGENKVGARPDRVMEAVRSADDHGERRSTLVAPATNPSRDGFAREIGAAALVEDDDRRVVWHSSENGSRFLGVSVWRPASTTLGQLDQIEHGKALAATEREASVEVSRRVIALDAGFEPAHGDGLDIQGSECLLARTNPASTCTIVAEKHSHQRIA